MTIAIVEAEMTATPVGPAIPLTVDVQVALGPDGKHWVLLTVGDALVTSTVRFPPASADQLAAQIAGNLTKAAVQARRMDTGLVVAGAMPVN